jgi:hypothetical protein
MDWMSKWMDAKTKLKDAMREWRKQGENEGMWWINEWMWWANEESCKSSGRTWWNIKGRDEQKIDDVRNELMRRSNGGM